MEEVGLWEVLEEIVVETEVFSRRGDEMNPVMQAGNWRVLCVGGLERRRNCLCAGRNQLKGFFVSWTTTNVECVHVVAIPHAWPSPIAHCARNARFFGCSSLSLQA